MVVRVHLAIEGTRAPDGLDCRGDCVDDGLASSFGESSGRTRRSLACAPGARAEVPPLIKGWRRQAMTGAPLTETPRPTKPEPSKFMAFEGFRPREQAIRWLTCPPGRVPENRDRVRRPSGRLPFRTYLRPPSRKSPGGRGFGSGNVGGKEAGSCSPAASCTF